MQKIIMVFTGVLLLCGLCDAGIVKVKAKGVAPYGMFSTTDARRQAVEDAKKNALRTYASNFDTARAKVFESELPRILEQVDVYIVSVEIIQDGKNKVSSNYEVVLEASIDETRIEQLVSKASALIAGPATGEAPAIVFVMVSRQAGTVKMFKDKKTDIEQSSVDTSEAKSIGADGLSLKSSDQATAVKTTGGSVERKAADVQYRVFSTPDANGAMNEIFSKAGFETIKPGDISIESSLFDTDFATGADITDATRKAAIEKCKENEVAYLLIGNMDVGAPDVDAATGMSRVYVKVTASVTDLTKKLPRNVASVRAVQYAGLGSDPLVAQQNALNIAATKSAADIVDQLRAKGIRAN